MPRIERDMHQTAKAVAQHMPGWKAIDTDNGAHYGLLERTEGAYKGARIGLYLDGYRGRISASLASAHVDGKTWTVRDHLTYEERQKPPVTDIGIAGDRAPEAIAREIARRLLPTALPLWSRVQEAIQKDRIAKGEVLKGAQQLAAALDEEIPEGQRDGYSFHLYEAPGAEYATFDVQHGGSVRVTLSMTFAQAVRVARLIKAAR